MATPIGNLEDITLRALRILKEVPLIAAEDTRRTKKLLNHFDIRTPLTSYHEHNKTLAGEKLIEHLLKGEDLALVTDAGLPSISDPGGDLTKLAIANDIRVIPIPGANAALTALIASGIDSTSFTFVGFLPKTEKKADEELNLLKDRPETLIFYAAPHDIKRTLKKLSKTFGKERKTTIARELTKTFEEFKRADLGELEDFYEANEAKGEFAIVVAGGTSEPKEPVNVDIMSLYSEKLNEGFEKKDAMREVAKILNIKRRDVYNEILKRSEDKM